MEDKRLRQESRGIEKYIRDIKIRLKFMKTKLILCCDNQYRYYLALNEFINDYAKKHKLFIRYICGKLSLKQLSLILGLSERQVARYLKGQREKFIEVIEEKEIQFYAQYPFNDKAIIGQFAELQG